MWKQMIGLLGVACVGIAVLGKTNKDEDEVRRKIVGTWKLVLEEHTLKDGRRAQYYGPNGKGFLIYSADGHMCALMMDPDRPKWKDAEKPTQEEKVSAFDGSYGYCGAYEINTKKSQVVHLPELSTGPGYIGTRQIRPYRFEGNRLILSGGPVEDEPDLAEWKVVWEKVK
jgi:hypothetical protein